MAKILLFNPERIKKPPKNKSGQCVILSFKLKPLNLTERIKNDVNYFATGGTRRERQC